MRLSTHVIVTGGLFFLLNSLIYSDTINIICLSLVAIFIGILPDIIDFKLLRGNHRNFLTHSPISPLFFIILLFLPIFLVSIQFQHGIILGVLLAVSFQLHLILDMLNPTGVPLLPNYYIKFAKIHYDNVLTNIVLDGIGVVLFMIPVFIN